MIRFLDRLLRALFSGVEHSRNPYEGAEAVFRREVGR